MPRPPLEKYPIEVLKAELERRARKAGKKLKKLLRVRAKLTEQITELEALTGTMAAPKAKLGRPPGKKRGPNPKGAAKASKRGRKGKPLAEYVHAVLAATEKGLSLKEIEAKVLAAGYPTTAESIYKPIMKVLGKGFKKVGRGVYALEAAVKAGEKAAKAVMGKKPAAKTKAPRKRGVFAKTGAEFVLGLVTTPKTSSDINAVWNKAGRGGTADMTLSNLFKAGKLKREKLKDARGSTYSLA
jgi:hypothetical protein